MKKMFNHTFFRFTLGFMGILIASFALSALVTHIDATSYQATAVKNIQSTE